jgi:ketosteroid isomerase-like protein
VAGLAACYDEKAIVVPQFSGVRRGRASIERLFRSWLSSSRVREFVVETEDLRILADVAVTLGTYRMIVDRAGNRPVSDQGQYLIVYERKSDGSWLISRDMSSSSRR